MCVFRCGQTKICKGELQCDGQTMEQQTGPPCDCWLYVYWTDTSLYVRVRVHAGKVNWKRGEGSMNDSRGECTNVQISAEQIFTLVFQEEYRRLYVSRFSLLYFLNRKKPLTENRRIKLKRVAALPNTLTFTKALRKCLLYLRVL